MFFVYELIKIFFESLKFFIVGVFLLLLLRYFKNRIMNVVYLYVYGYIFVDNIFIYYEKEVLKNKDWMYFCIVL